MQTEKKCREVMYFSLLHVNLDASQSPNLKGSVRRGLRVYIRCAILLAKSLSRRGCCLVLYTNSPELLLEMEPRLENYLKIDILSSEIEIPLSLRFYSAHQKIAAFDSVSKKTDLDYGLFLDLDCVAFNLNFVDELHNCNYKLLNIYEEQISSYGESVVSRSIESIAHSKNTQRIWIGGEFLYASRFYLKRIVDECMVNLKSYLSAIDSMHHVGDEALVSASFVKSGLVFNDVNSSVQNVCRLWSVRVRHSSVGLKGLNANIVHFPADKYFLSILSYLPFNPIVFKIFYIPYYFHRKTMSYFKYLLSSIF